MAELNAVNEDDLEPSLKEAFAAARAGRISPSVFLAMLEEHGMSNIERLLHTHRVFGLPLHTVKEMEQKRGKGINDIDEHELISLIERLEEEPVGGASSIRDEC